MTAPSPARRAMYDDPNLNYDDGWFRASRPHEYQYFRFRLSEAFPAKSVKEIAEAVFVCRNKIKPAEGREKLSDCIFELLSGD